jgi:peptidyl-prolyl cis-trans isomerase SurA
MQAGTNRFPCLTGPTAGPLIRHLMKCYFRFARLPLLLALLALPLTFAVAQTNRLNGVVAIIDGTVITAHQVQAAMEKLLPNLRMRFGNQPARYREEVAKLQNAVLESLIERQLVLADFKAAGYKVPDAYFDDYFQKQVVGSFGDRVDFVQTLQKEGKTIEDARREFREELIVSMMSQQKIKNQITISPFKIERYYQENPDKFLAEESVKLRMIVIPLAGAGDSATIERARDLRWQLEAGAAFEELAKAHSTGVPAARRGEVTTNLRAQLREELATVAFAAQAGDISEPIVTEDAVFILKIEEVKPAGLRPLAEVRDEIDQALQAEESARRRKQWIDSIRAKAFIRLF